MSISSKASDSGDLLACLLNGSHLHITRSHDLVPVKIHPGSQTEKKVSQCILRDLILLKLNQHGYGPLGVKQRAVILHGERLAVQKLLGVVHSVKEAVEKERRWGRRWKVI